MWDGLDEWLQRGLQLDTRRSGRRRPTDRLAIRVLVLCRSRASVALVRRWAAERGGVPGLEVATPSTLAAQCWQPRTLLGSPEPPPLDDAAFPAGTVAAAWVGDRPGLVAVARRWVRWLRLARQEGQEGQEGQGGQGGQEGAPLAPRWLSELAARSWGVDEEERAVHGLLARARARGRHLLDVAWDRVLCLGFHGGGQRLGEPWEHQLLELLEAEPLARSASEEPSPVAEAPLPALHVPDVVAEVRVAALLAQHDPEGTLVLVANEDTARRVRDALRRNGMACDWRELLPVRAHGLAAVVRRCAGWFQEPDPWVQVADLAAVLRHLSLGAELHPAAEAWLARQLEHRWLEAYEARLDRAGIVALLERARILEAPLSRWTHRMEELGESVSPAESRGASKARDLRGHALAVAVRLRILAAAVRGESVEQALGTGEEAPLDFDPDDFEAIVAELLGDAAPPAAAEPGTLGAVRSFLVGVRVRIQEDPAARAILAALGRRAHWPVSPAHVVQALGGSVDPGVLRSGVQVVTYEDYDGRPARQLVLLDVHDKGVGRQPAPDPLLTEAQIEALGAVPGPAWVLRQLDQVRRAAASAERVLAVVTRCDPEGREVVVPILLPLAPLAGSPGSADLPAIPGPIPSYGIGLPGLPEEVAHAGLVRGEGAPAAPARGPAGWRRLAVQATAEWYREGRGPMLPVTAPQGPSASLVGHLESSAWPAYVRPWLGETGCTEHGGLPSGPQSATGLFTAVSHCMYQAFGAHVLGLRPVEEVTEDLDPREVGQAVHEALQRASAGSVWHLPRDAADGEREHAAEALAAALRVHTTEAFERAARALGGVSAAREASVRGRLQRWNRHWTAFARSRLGGPRRFKDFDQVKNHPLFARAEQICRALSPAAGPVPSWRLQRWLLHVASGKMREVARLHPDLQLDTGTPEPLPSAMAPDLPAILHHPEVVVLEKVVRNLRWRAKAPELPVEAMGAEVPFGFPEAEPVPWVGPDLQVLDHVDLGDVKLELGAGTVPVRGRIDQLVAVANQPRTLLCITDYKTGRAPEGWSFRRKLLELAEPQLLVYALVMHEVQGRSDLPESLRDAAVASVGWDHVKRTFKEPERRGVLDVPDTAMCIDTAVLDWARDQLGRLLDRAREGRWPLRPREDTCPQLRQRGHDHCAFAAACRLRGLPPAPPTEEAS